MSAQTIIFRAPRATDGIGQVSEGSDIPVMRPRTGRRGSDAALIKLLDEALANLARADCSFWACRGPSRPESMCTCVKCWAMRNVATARVTLATRTATPEKAGTAPGVVATTGSAEP
jgi:hypothetical protein